MQLSRHQQWIDDGAEVIDAGIADDLHDAGFRIDLDFGDVAAVGEGRWYRLGGMVDIERRRYAFRHLAFAQAARQFDDVDRAIGTGDGETTVRKLDVGFGGFHQMRRRALALLDDQLRGFDDRHPRGGDGARAAGAAAGMHDVAVALLELYALEGHAKLRREHLRERRRVTLAIIERAGDQPDRAVILEQDLAELDAGRGGDFEIGADRNASELALLAALLLAFGETSMIGNFERLVEHALEIAAVVGDAGRRRERHLRRLDEIALAQRQPVDAHFVGGAVDQPLHVVVGLGPSGAAIGAHQRGVGQYRLDVDGHQRGAVDAGEVLADVERQRARRDAGDVGAEIAVA